MNPVVESSALERTLGELRELVEHLHFPLATADRDRGTQLVHEVKTQIDDYVAPRLAALDAPLLVVIGGSTGAGKSTLANSLVGAPVSPSGVLRPTTRTPVLLHHPDDAEWFSAASILPDVPRVSADSTEVYAIRQVSSDRIAPGIGVLDAPDFDSIDAGNRALADQLLAAADLWLFVTSAARYADQVPWGYLRRAAERAASVAVVLDRTAPDQISTVIKDLGRLMTSNGLSDSPLFAVPETALDEAGLLPAEHTAEIHEWLRDLAADEISRRIVVGSTVDGAVRQLTVKSRAAADLCLVQAETADQLQNDAQQIYAESTRELIDEISQGALLRGEVLARWQEFVGTGEFFRNLEVKVGRLRDRIFGRAPSGSSSADDVEAAMGSGIHLLVLDHAEQSAAEVARAWSSSAAGDELLAHNRSLDRASRDVQTRAERLAREWRASVFALVEKEGEGKKNKAKAMTWGVNAVGVSLMVVVFAGTAGLTGAEVGIAGGTAAVGHKVLEAVFGDQAVRELVRTAQADLQRRIEALFADELARYTAVLPNAVDLRAVSTDVVRVANELESERVMLDLSGRHLESPVQEAR